MICHELIYCIKNCVYITTSLSIICLSKLLRWVYSYEDNSEKDSEDTDDNQEFDEGEPFLEIFNCFGRCHKMFVYSLLIYSSLFVNRQNYKLNETGLFTRIRLAFIWLFPISLPSCVSSNSYSIRWQRSQILLSR